MKDAKREDDRLLLIRTLDNMGVEIRHGSFDSQGGLARVSGQYVVFVRQGISIEGEVELYCDALKKIGTQGVHVPPRVRALLGEEGW